LELVSLLSPALGPDVDDIMEEHLEVYSDNYLTDHVNRMCLADARMFLPGLNLAYTDRATMAASTEVRLPFVDPLVFRAAFSPSGNRKVSGTTGKVTLKRAARAWLPNEIIRRPKASFSLPLRAWVTRDLRGLIDDVLVNGELVRTGFVQAESLGALIADDRAGHQDRSKQIWQLLTLELWYRQACQAGVGV
jgi:asparagine synthase (glutamine-hydrolysing)